MNRYHAQDNFGSDLAAVEAALKRHEGVETDVKACEKRIEAVVSVADELQREDYHDIKRISDRWRGLFTIASSLIHSVLRHNMNLRNPSCIMKFFVA